MAQKKQTTSARDARLRGSAATDGQVVTLADLAPRHDVTGGSGRRVFGSDPITPSVDKERRDMKATKPTAKKAKDLPAKSGVKGGGQNLNDNITMVRAAKPTKKSKDLPPKSGSVKGGRLAGNDNVTLLRAAKPAPKKRDLPSRKDVKGGILRRPGGNDNMTLVRNAKPAPKKRDLPSRKDVTGGKKKA